MAAGLTLLVAHDVGRHDQEPLDPRPVGGSLTVQPQPQRFTVNVQVDVAALFGLVVQPGPRLVAGADGYRRHAARRQAFGPIDPSHVIDGVVDVEQLPEPAHRLVVAVGRHERLDRVAGEEGHPGVHGQGDALEARTRALARPDGAWGRLPGPSSAGQPLPPDPPRPPWRSRPGVDVLPAVGHPPSSPGALQYPQYPRHRGRRQAQISGQLRRRGRPHLTKQTGRQLHLLGVRAQRRDIDHRHATIVAPLDHAGGGSPEATDASRARPPNRETAAAVPGSCSDEGVGGFRVAESGQGDDHLGPLPPGGAQRPGEAQATAMAEPTAADVAQGAVEPLRRPLPGGGGSCPQGDQATLDAVVAAFLPPDLLFSGGCQG
ncbi:MAG: hypothetical protein M3256_00740 [Actinomycetota bacterium]|nr:hypothetical protein [Actinomycetota bacterium]